MRGIAASGASSDDRATFTSSCRGGIEYQAGDERHQREPQHSVHLEVPLFQLAAVGTKGAASMIH
jgi:hypothetical protein